MTPDQDPLEYLAAADPELADRMRAGISTGPFDFAEGEVRFLVDEILAGFVKEFSFGQAYARGILDLIGVAAPAQLRRYCALVGEAGRTGPALGKRFAGALVQVVAHDPGTLTDRFLQVTDIMLTKGAHTLQDPLATLSGFLAAEDIACAREYLELLAEVFARPLTYNRCQRISKRLPRLAAALPRIRRPFQLAALRRVMAADDILMEPFFDGLEKGVSLLDEKSLALFVTRGLETFERDRAHGIRFLELASLPAVEACRELQVAVPLNVVRDRLDRYLQARVGKGLTVKSLADMPAAYGRPGEDACVCFDGATLYFSDVMNRFSSRPANTDLYMCLARLEAGCAEFGTFDFDLARAIDRQEIDLVARPPAKGAADLEQFFNTFGLPDLAADLFTLIEHGRLRKLLAAKYPGLDRKARKVVGREVTRLLAAGCRPAFLYALYARIALGMNGEMQRTAGTPTSVMEAVAGIFESRITAGATV